MPIQTSQLLTIIFSGNPSIDEFNQLLSQDDTGQFEPLTPEAEALLAARLSMAHPLQSLSAEQSLFLALYYQLRMSAGEAPAMCLAAALKKLAQHGHPHYLVQLMEFIAYYRRDLMKSEQNDIQVFVFSRVVNIANPQPERIKNILLDLCLNTRVSHFEEQIKNFRQYLNDQNRLAYHARSLPEYVNQVNHPAGINSSLLMAALIKPLLNPAQLYYWRLALGPDANKIEANIDDIACLLPDSHGHYTPFGVFYGLRFIGIEYYHGLEAISLAINAEQSIGLPLVLQNTGGDVYKPIFSIIIEFLFDLKTSQEAFGRLLTMLQQQYPSLFSGEIDEAMSDQFNQKLRHDCQDRRKANRVRDFDSTHIDPIRQKLRVLAERKSSFFNPDVLMKELGGPKLEHMQDEAILAPLYIEFDWEYRVDYIERCVNGLLSRLTGNLSQTGSPESLIRAHINTLIYLIDLIPGKKRQIVQSIKECLKFSPRLDVERGRDVDPGHFQRVSEVYYASLYGLLFLVNRDDATVQYVIDHLRFLRVDINRQAIFDKTIERLSNAGDELTAQKLNALWEQSAKQENNINHAGAKDKRLLLTEGIQNRSHELEQYMLSCSILRGEAERQSNPSLYVFDPSCVINQGMYLPSSPAAPTAGRDQWGSLPYVFINRKGNASADLFKVTESLNLHTLTLPVALALFRHQNFNLTTYRAVFTRDDFDELLPSVLVFCLLGRDDRIFRLASHSDYGVDSYEEAFIRLAIKTELRQDQSLWSLEWLKKAILAAQQWTGRSTTRDEDGRFLCYIPIMPLLVKGSPAFDQWVDLAELNHGEDNYEYECMLQFATYLEKSSAISNAFYQTMVLNQESLMSVILFNTSAFNQNLEDDVQEIELEKTRQRILSLLSENSLTEATKIQLLEKIKQSKYADPRSVVFALAHIELEPKERDELIRKHLLNQMVTFVDLSPELLSIMRLLNDEAFKRLKNQINAWAIESQVHKDFIKTLISAKKEDVSALLFILRVGRTTYCLKNTQHYNLLYAVIMNNQRLAEKVASEYGLLNPASSEAGTELQDVPPHDALDSHEVGSRAIFEAFLNDHFNGQIDWSHEAPCLPLRYELPKSLYLDLWKPEELLVLLGKKFMAHPSRNSREFILYLLRQHDMPVLQIDWQTEMKPALLVFAQIDLVLLLGKDPTIFAIGRDKSRQLCSYEDLIIKYGIEQNDAYQVRNLHSYASYFNKNNFNFLISAYEDKVKYTYQIFNVYIAYAKQSPAIAKALRRAYLLECPGPIFKELLNSQGGYEEKQKATLFTYLKGQPVSDDTLTIIELRIKNPEHPKLAKIVDTILYIGLSNSYDAIVDTMHETMLTLNNAEPLYIPSLIEALKKLSGEELARLKFRLNQYCYTHKSILNPDALMSNNYADDSLPALVLVLKIGRTKFQVEKNGRYYNALCLFMTDKAQTEADKARYGLTEQSPKQPS